MRTITRLYDHYSTAQDVVRSLEGAGLPPDDISLVANERGAAYPGTSGTGITETGATSAGPTGIGTVAQPPDTSVSTSAGRGAAAGTFIGGGLGLLAGIGSLALPGIGPVVAAGWLATTLAGASIGATAGGIVGALTATGLSRDEADVYAEEIRRGASLVSVRAPDGREAEVEAIMDRYAPVDWRARRGTYGADWRGFSAGNPAGSGPPPEAAAPDAAVPAADRTLTNRSADRLENAGERDRRRVMESASRTGSSIDERLAAAEERLRARRPGGPEAIKDEATKDKAPRDETPKG